MKRNIQPRPIKYFCWNHKYVVMAYGSEDAFLQIANIDLKGKEYLLLKKSPQNDTGAFCYWVRPYDKRMVERYYIVEPVASEMERRKQGKYKKRYILNSKR